MNSEAYYFPASFAQERLWFLDQLEPDSAAYIIASAHRFVGPLNLAALERSLGEIVRRHEILRTTFSIREGQPVQVIAAVIEGESLFNLPVTCPEDSSAVTHWIEQEARTPFNLEQGPLFRGRLLRLGDEEHILILVMHHIISDGWSMGVLWSELSQLYTAFTLGQPSPLPDLPVQYADFSTWQRQHLQGKALQDQLGYWKGQLSGAAAQNFSALGRSPAGTAPEKTLPGLRFTSVIPPELGNALKAISRSQDSTLFMTLLAAFSILLQRYTRQDDILVGSPIANRSRSEIEDLIGFFVNTLVLRSDLSGDPSFLQLLARVRETCLQAYSYQDLPFEKLVEELNPPRDLGHNPFFEVLFAFQNTPLRKQNLPGLSVTPVEIRSTRARFPLEMHAWELKNNALRLVCTLDPQLFDTGAAARLAGHYQALLEGIAANPSAPISSLPILTHPEQNQILGEWNAAAAEFPPACIHTLFEQQVERTPAAPALAWGSQQISFQALNAHANQVAHTLLACGAGPETLVGVWMDRSIDTVTALLGVLKAGAAYVPLDPAYPKERLSFILHDSAAALLLTQKEWLPGLPQHSARVICLDADLETLAQASQANPAAPVKPENLAYVLYTSGSTGLPKGVAIEHRSAAAFLQWAQTVITPEERRGVLASTSFNFDLSLFELFLPLCFGGCAVLVQNLLALPETPSAPPITLINTVPSLVTALLKSFSLPLSARTVCLAGEPLPQALVQQLYTQPGVQRVLNLYGPTETTTYSTWAPIEKDAPPPPPIGRPIANTRVYLLDAALQPAPVGVPAELFIAGAGLARGYLNRPELTAEKFVTLHLPGLPPQRAYRSGDLVRWSPEGCLEYLGRLDSQVKIRGFRIELGEIESVLAQHPAVKESVVLAREDEPGEKRLAAYIIPAPGADPTPGELRAFLKERLPEFMLPAAFVFLESFPFTPSGKVNRRALPAPESENLPAGSEFISPRDGLELQLAQIWQKVLNRPSVGMSDNFFEIGGHSLLAIRLFTLIEQETGKKLPVAALFKAPTVGQLAEVIRCDSPGEGATLVVINANGAKQPLFFVHGIGGSVMGYGELARLLGADQPVYGLQAAGMDGVEEPDTTIEAMASRFISAMRIAQPHGPYAVGGYCIGGMIAFEIARQLAEQGEQVALLAVIEAYPPPRALKLGSRSTPTLPDRMRSAGFRLRNLGYWLSDFIHRRDETIWPAFLRRTRRRVNGARLPIEAEDFIGEDARNLTPAVRHVIRVHSNAQRAYLPAPFPGRLTLLRGRRVPLRFAGAPDVGWAKLALGGVELKLLPVTHHSVMLSPDVNSLAEALKACLNRQ